jgi:hypothetical protein
MVRMPLPAPCSRAKAAAAPPPKMPITQAPIGWVMPASRVETSAGSDPGRLPPSLARRPGPARSSCRRTPPAPAGSSPFDDLYAFVVDHLRGLVHDPLQHGCRARASLRRHCDRRPRRGCPLCRSPRRGSRGRAASRSLGGSSRATRRKHPTSLPEPWPFDPSSSSAIPRLGPRTDPTAGHPTRSGAIGGFF